MSITNKDNKKGFTYEEGKKIVLVTGKYIRETDKAEYIRLENGKKCWLPKSQMGKTTQILDSDTRECEVYIPLWLSDKNEMDYEDIEPEDLDLQPEDMDDMEAYREMKPPVDF